MARLHLPDNHAYLEHVLVLQVYPALLPVATVCACMAAIQVKDIANSLENRTSFRMSAELEYSAIHALCRVYCV